MWEWYLSIVTEHPFAAAAVQFALLGTVGELLSTRIRDGSWGAMLHPPRLALKAVGWALLGVYVKVMFLTASAGVKALADFGALPLATAAPDGTLELILAAFAASALMNVMLGPSMMVLHRGADNAIDRVLGAVPAGWRGLDKGMLTLLWLWIPLHTITFTQPREVRIGIAAVLSMVLGVVMGWTNRRTPVRAP
jgi:hypothetical protein